MDAQDQHYVDLAAAVDAIAGSTFREDFVETFTGTVVDEMVAEYIADNGNDDDGDGPEVLRDELRGGRMEVLIDDMDAALLAHGYRLDRTEASGWLHFIVRDK